MPRDLLTFPAPRGDWRGPIPVPDLDSAGFWEGLRHHEIRLLRCRECGYWIHPPLAMCPSCHSFELHFEVTSSVGTVYTYTVIYREFVPGLEPPYVAALVEIPSQSRLRLLTNLVNCTEPDLRNWHAGARCFSRHCRGRHAPLFEPIGEEGID